MARGRSLLRVMELSALLVQSEKQNEEKEKTVKTLDDTVEILVGFPFAWAIAPCLLCSLSTERCGFLTRRPGRDANCRGTSGRWPKYSGCVWHMWSQSRCRQWQGSCRQLGGVCTTATLPVTLSLQGSKFLGSEGFVAVSTPQLLVFLFLALAKQQLNRSGKECVGVSRAVAYGRERATEDGNAREGSSSSLPTLSLLSSQEARLLEREYEASLAIEETLSLRKLIKDLTEASTGLGPHPCQSDFSVLEEGSRLAQGTDTDVVHCLCSLLLAV